MNFPRRPLILDIDFTLIHLEFVPSAIEVPGRTRSAWLALQTVEVLGQMQDRFDIILATARSWDGTRWVADGLRERGVSVQGVVVEDGARWGEIGNLQAFAPDFDVAQLRAGLVMEAGAPRFEWQLDFQNCAVARCQTPADAAHLMTIFATQKALQKWFPRFYRDGRKVYVLPRSADKWSALQRLLGAHASRAAGVGDGENDLVWLPKVAQLATFKDAAPDLVEAVRARGGLIGDSRGHKAIVEILNALKS